MQFRASGFEFWGGIECTINRVQDVFYDQLRFTGHYSRPDDLARIASLGIAMMRFPVLWEAHQPRQDTAIEWQRTKRQLDWLKGSNIEPIVGLVHHGSGPVFTNLADHAFPENLASYAHAVARKFPWVRYYTPVNEPLTTARFSGLYGFWYPHHRNDLSCMKMLLHQVKGIVLAMRAIREVNPEAKLIQTEDLGKTFSSSALSYQAEFENERRWLTYDLLCGRVNRDHALWEYLKWVGVPENALAFFEENYCVPDIAGFNYYLTSERYLDEETELYPEYLHGGNHRHRYVDTEAIRIDHGNPYGLAVLLQEAWERYGLPMAVTEAFLSCTEDEQVRWLHDVLQDCRIVRDKGIDLRAVTFWALLGQSGWNKLVTSLQGEYEPGAFDVRSHPVRETLTASFIKQTISNCKFHEELLKQPGWWKREERFHVRSFLV